MMSLNEIEMAVEVLLKGGVILYPTETVWGLGCDSTNSEAVAKVFSMKGRSSAKAMISLVDSVSSLTQWLKCMPVKAHEIIERESGIRPVTIIYDNPVGISSKLVAPDGSAAFRVIERNYTAELCRKLGRPLVSTSANLAGKPTPLSFEDIDDSIKSRVDFICREDKERSSNMPSKILKITNEGDVSVIRE